MGEVNFYLKEPAKKTGTTPIYLRYLYNGKSLNFSFGQSIQPRDWNANKQRVKNKKQTTADGKHSLNDLLDSLMRQCEKTYNDEVKNGIPAPETIKAKLSEFINQNESEVNGPSTPNFFSLINRFTNNEIKHKGRDKSKSTVKTYKTLAGHLYEFEKIKKEKVDFDTITLDFYYKFVDYLKNRGQYEKAIRAIRPELKKKRVDKLNNNSISKDIQILKVIMGEAVDLGYTNNMQFKHKKFSVFREETDAVYLTDNEILVLYRYDFSNNKRLEAVRDLFVFGAYVGLRYSDYSTVKPENIVTIDGELFIKMITQKTGELVIIPCNPIVLEIFRKYDSNPNKLPRSISNVKFNAYIKEACKIAGLTEVGRLSTEPHLQLWETVSSHTCRRAFSTNLYLAGFPTIDLMKITGHKTEKAFLKYIRVDKLSTAKRLSEHIRKNWSSKLLKVAS
jgi:integrase